MEKIERILIWIIYLLYLKTMTPSLKRKPLLPFARHSSLFFKSTQSEVNPVREKCLIGDVKDCIHQMISMTLFSYNILLISYCSSSFYSTFNPSNSDIFTIAGLEGLKKLEMKKFKYTPEQFQQLQLAVLGSLEILEKAPRLWKGDEEEKLRAAQEAARAATGAVRGHVMLSYNQKSCSDYAMKMHKKLKGEGIPTWIDVEDMRGGNLMDNMSSAVENAAIVVSFVHNLYKESGNCRREADYAAVKNKRILFAHCQPGYQADGWLGILMGNSLYYNLGGNFEAESALLMKHIKQILQEGKSIDQVQTGARSSGQAGAGASGGAVGGSHEMAGAQGTGTGGCSTWSASQVQDWLKSNDIDFLCKPFALSPFSLVFIVTFEFMHFRVFFYHFNRSACKI